MADENEAGATPDIQPEATAEIPRPEGAAQTERQAGAEAEKTGSGQTAAKDNSKERGDTFAVYQNALENVDWGYKLKSGEERDIGHKSMMIAERAFIAASVFDAKDANKIYEQYAGRPPKEDLIKRAEAHRETLKTEGQTHGGASIPDLTAGIASVTQRRDLAKLHATQDEIEKKMGNWDSSLGDSQSRSRSHMKSANDQLLKQERPRDDGMHLFAAFRGGMRAADEYGEMFHHRKRGMETLRTVRDQRAEHKDVKKKIATFGKVEGVEMKDTTGPNGVNVARFQKAFGVVKTAMAKPAAAPAMTPGAPSAAMIAQQAAARSAGPGR